MIFLLTPRGWEPSGESWTAWAPARILSETGGFPVFSRNPLYVLYLAALRSLRFPYSVELEHALTHVFALTAIYALVNVRLGRVRSLLFTTALLPALATVEGGGTVAAVGFFSLYLRRFATDSAATRWSLLPPALPAAALCHAAYWPFVLGHLTGSAYHVARRALGKRQTTIAYGGPWTKVATLLLVAFVIVAAVRQSGRIDNNHGLMDPRFSPVPLTSAINTGFFQFQTWNLVARENKNDPSALPSKDWYFETPRFFGESRSIAGVVRNKPELFFRIVFQNFKEAFWLPLRMFSLASLNLVGTDRRVYRGLVAVSVLFWALLLAGLLEIRRHHGYVAVSVLLFGTAAIIVALAMTNFNFRYVATLLPVFVLVYVSSLRSGAPKSARSVVRTRRFTEPIFVAGCVLMLGSALQAYGTAVSSDCAYFCKADSGARSQISSVIEGRGFLSRSEGVSMAVSYEDLVTYIDRSSRILSLEHNFFGAFSNVAIDNNYQIWSLPPYSDASSYSEDFLSEIDVFFVSNDLVDGSSSVSTQSFLRYQLHIAPFLRKNGERFRVADVPRYGQVYIRRRPSDG